MAGLFGVLCKSAAEHNEYRDCAVKAVAAVCGMPYEDAHKMFALKGRKPRKATPRFITTSVLDAFGFKQVRIDKPAKTTKTLPAAMEALGRSKGRYLVYTSGHVAAFVDGVVEDWTAGRCTRIQAVYEVIRVWAQPTTSTPVPVKPPKPTPAGPVAVRADAHTRGYMAGVIIAKHGVEAGVTDAMVAELDEMYGEVNPRQSIFYLRIAWHAIKGMQAAQK